LKILIASDLHFSVDLAREIVAVQEQLPAGEYDHMREGRLFWHNEMLVDEMGAMLSSLRHLVEEENPDLLLFLGDLLSTNWSVNIQALARNLKPFHCPIELVTGNHDISLSAPECRLQDALALGTFETGLRCRLFEQLGLLFLDLYVQDRSGNFHKWIDPDGDVVCLSYRPEDVEQALSILAQHPEIPFLIFGHFPMCDPEDRIHGQGRKVSRGSPVAWPLAELLNKPGNLIGIITGHQHFNHLQRFKHGFHWTLPSLVEYPCAVAVLEVSHSAIQGRLLIPDLSIAQRSLHALNAVWTYGSEKEQRFSLPRTIQQAD
jgi:calcineurin-like phosphoesterase family protein